MKGMRIFVAMWTLALAACGGGIQAPDYSDQLKSLDIYDPVGVNGGAPGAKVTGKVIPTDTGTPVQLAAKGIYEGKPIVDVNGSPSTSDSALKDVNVEWSSDNEAVATVDRRNGLVTPVAAGEAHITATSGKKAPALTIKVTGPPPSPNDIVGLAIFRVGGTDPVSPPLGNGDSIPVGAQRTYQAFAVFRDATKALAPVAVNWTIPATPVVLQLGVPPTNPSVQKPVAVLNTAAVGNTSTLTATLPINAQLGTTQAFSATVDITVSNASFASLDAIILTPASPAVIGSTVQATARATFIDGGNVDQALQIPNFNLDWTSSVDIVGSIDGQGTITTGGTTTGGTPRTTGTTRITGSIKSGTFPLVTAIESRTKFTDLVVKSGGGGTDNPPGTGICESAFLAPTATITVPAPGPLCLLCSVADAPNIIDAVDGNFATINVPVGLLGLADPLAADPTGLLGSLLGPNGLLGGLGLSLDSLLGLANNGTLGLALPIDSNLASASVVVSSSSEIAAGKKAAFVIGFPVSDLLSLELLNQFTVTTFNSANVAQETATVANNALVLELLGNAVLPGVSSGEQALVGFITTKPYSKIKFTYSAGIATALSSLQVFNACSDVPAGLLESGGIVIPGTGTGGTGGIPGLSDIPVLGDLLGDLLGGLLGG